MLLHLQVPRFGAALTLVLPLLVACHEDDSLNPPPAPPVPSGGPLFQRYVSMGSSITAGFQSDGINGVTQQQSYAVLFAQAAGTEFVIPVLQGRGCRPPFTNNVTQTRVGGGTATTCDGRASARTDIHNVAIPGARVLDVLTNLGMPSSSNPLTLILLGGRTQVEAMQDRQPTFVSLWIGKNDVLGSFTNAANPGNPALITPQSTFETQYGQVLDAIEATGAEAALLSVPDVTVIPFASAGTIYFCGSFAGAPLCGLTPQFPPNFQVDASCAPGAAGGQGDVTLIPWTIGVVRILTAAQDPGNTYSVNCTLDNEVVTSTELAGLQAAVAGYNTYIQAQATSRGWAYTDINGPLLALKADGTIPSFPDITQVASGQPVGFGTIFTQDGVHPSAAAHRIIADSVISAVNQTYGTAIPFVGP